MNPDDIPENLHLQVRMSKFSFDSSVGARNRNTLFNVVVDGGSKDDLHPAVICRFAVDVLDSVLTTETTTKREYN
jgi:hypothetical protein